MNNAELLVEIEKLLDRKLDEKLDKKLDEKLDKKLDEKLDAKFKEELGPIRQDIQELKTAVPLLMHEIHSLSEGSPGTL